MKKVILAVTVLALTLMAGAAFGTTADMIAGNPKNPPANVVGTVEVTNDGTNLTVTYTITAPDYIITSTHLHVTTIDPAGLENYKKVAGATPQTNKGNAIPGQFAYSSSHEVADGETVVTHVIPLSSIPAAPGQTLYVAAHAIVGSLCPCDSDTCEDLDLPTDVIVSVLWAGDAGASGETYFDATISGGTNLDGMYHSWCVDTDRSVRPQGLGRGIPLQAIVYCDCYDMPVLVAPDNPLVENCDNMGKINWIVNNVSVGQAITEINPGTTCTGNITYGDMQLAIWDLADDNRPGGSVSGWGLGDYEECRVAEIIAAAEADEAANGVFMPICGEEMAIIILPYVYMIDTSDPADGIPDVVLTGADPAIPRYDNLPAEAVLVYVQPIIIEIPVPCCLCDDTAWAGVEGTDDPGPDDGDGYTIEFLGKDWSMYFTHIVTVP